MYPRLFAGTPFETSVWGVSVVVGFIIVLSIGLPKRPKDFPMGYTEVFVCSLFMLYSGFIGSKLLYILLHSKAAYVLLSGKKAPLFFIPPDIATAGSAFLGALTFAFLTILAFTKLRIRRISFLRAADYFTPFLLLHQAFVRVGCFLSGCCYGKPTNLPWGCIFRGTPPPRHPTQVYEIFYLVAIYFIMRHIYRKGALPGVVFLGCVCLYGGSRFFNEFLRVDSPMVLGPLTLANITMLTIALVSGIALAILLRDRKKR